MLIIKEEVKPRGLTFGIDKYVPFTIEFGSQPLQLFSWSAGGFYWRAGDGESSLIEIGLNREYGAICSVTLVNINAGNVKETEEPFNTDLPEVEGDVVFDISNWKANSDDYSDRFQDEFDLDICLVIGEDYLTLGFNKLEKPSRYIRNNQVRLGVSSKDELSTIEIIELTSGQIELLKQAF